MKQIITEKQFHRLTEISKYIKELNICFEKLSRDEAQKLIQKYQLDMRIPRKPIICVYGRDTSRK